MNKDEMIKQGFKELRDVQLKYNKRIDKAPVKGGWDQLQGRKVASAWEQVKAKNQAMREIIKDYAVFGILLVDSETLETLEEKEESLVDRTRRELRE